MAEALRTLFLRICDEAWLWILKAELINRTQFSCTWELNLADIKCYISRDDNVDGLSRIMYHT